MTKEPPDKNEVNELRGLIDEFLEGRLAPKLEDIEKKIASAPDPETESQLEDKRQQLLLTFERETWLAGAAKRVTQIQMVTHANKYAHPNAKGTSIFATDLHTDSKKEFIGSHTFGSITSYDVVGNAAALDVFKFLKIEFQGRTVLDRVRERDNVLVEALCDDNELANNWVDSFSLITQGNTAKSSHAFARQLYFPLADGGYHLLSPLFPTSFVHNLYQRLREERFSESVKEARQAKKDGKLHDHGYHDYPGLATQVFGGSKPQNISQLNSERHGENWLFPSCPPAWRTKKIRPPLGTTTVFRRWFGARHTVRELTKALSGFLVSTGDYSNMRIRNARADMVDRLSDELFQFAAELAELLAGWSAKSECHLAISERLWLDPERAKDDEAFGRLYEQGDWKDEIAARFGNWLNNQLRFHKSLPLGDAESAEWKDVVEEKLKTIKLEIAHD